jgi:hypothetical protein
MTALDAQPAPEAPPDQGETLRARRFFEVEGRDCTITIEPRPLYCDRGHWIAKLHPRGDFASDIDGSDGWPRYYFGWEAMTSEIAAWLDARGQR